jgi:hypothetical protein
MQLSVEGEVYTEIVDKAATTGASRTSIGPIRNSQKEQAISTRCREAYANRAKIPRKV